MRSDGGPGGLKRGLVSGLRSWHNFIPMIRISHLQPKSWRQSPSKHHTRNKPAHPTSQRLRRPTASLPSAAECWLLQHLLLVTLTYSPLAMDNNGITSILNLRDVGSTVNRFLGRRYVLLRLKQLRAAHQHHNTLTLASPNRLIREGLLFRSARPGVFDTLHMLIMAHFAQPSQMMPPRRTENASDMTWVSRA